jgi:PhzF family phenazine biosynthesis protein
MELILYQIDAFTDTIFGGNPACVVPLNKWLPDEILLKIAKENAVAETAFFVDKGEKIHLRWFTPEIEMDLCGHATLATAHCLTTILDYQKGEIVFKTPALRRVYNAIGYAAQMSLTLRNFINFIGKT